MNLPIETVLPDLLRSLTENSNVVLEAPPGAGKTTRVPLALLKESWLKGQKILMLEPRRLAARAAARFMAKTLGEEVGETVGYRVRLDSMVGPKTRIEVVTEGVLTRFLQNDPSLEGYGIVIFDEFHERSLQSDLGLALCRESQLALREDLKLLVMSATLDGAAVSAIIGNAPVIMSEGRAHPVEVRYLPASERFDSYELVRTVASAIGKALREEEGNILVFLPGQREIRNVEAALREKGADKQTMIAPLYGSLSPQEQDVAISPVPLGERKVVLATNIAETSLTIEGIRIVIDSGFARTSLFDPASGMTGLKTLPISQASAEQRKGRAGRLEPGVCYRLWSENRKLLSFSRPEIMEADLAPLLLELAQWGCSDPKTLAWLDPPPEAAYMKAKELLVSLGGLNQEGRITQHGKTMALLPMHPRLAHMVLRGKRVGEGRLACDLAALLGEADMLRGEGERSADIHSRLLLLFAENPSQGNRGVMQRIRKGAEQFRKLAEIPIKGKTADLSKAGLLLTFAYPDRIARRRPGHDSRFLLANGKGACFSHPEPLSASEYLVVVNLDVSTVEARIFLAAEIAREEILEHFSELIEIRDFVRWDSREEAVASRRQTKLGAVLLEDKPLANPDPELIVGGIIEGIRALGLSCLPWSREAQEWRERITFLYQLGPQEWPEVSDKALLASLENWLAPFLAGSTRREHLKKIDLKKALLSLVPWEKQRLLDELAPTHITVPSGSRVALDYSQFPPVLPVRLQEMFGAVDTPRIAGGKVAVLLHLLSPARRPVQVTQDLAGFWKNSYHEVKRELKGRYPKHYWPEDPLQAEPTSRAKPRNR